jgi:hypothetical protein
MNICERGVHIEKFVYSNKLFGEKNRNGVDCKRIPVFREISAQLFDRSFNPL